MGKKLKDKCFERFKLKKINKKILSTIFYHF